MIYDIARKIAFREAFPGVVERQDAMGHGESGLMLEVADVVHAFGPVVALDHVSLDARKGEFLTILGESGSGKTTRLRVISGL